LRKTENAQPTDQSDRKPAAHTLRGAANLTLF